MLFDIDELCISNDKKSYNIQLTGPPCFSKILNRLDLEMVVITDYIKVVCLNWRYQSISWDHYAWSVENTIIIFGKLVHTIYRKYYNFEKIGTYDALKLL